MEYKKNHAAEFSAKGFNLISIALYLSKPKEYTQLKNILKDIVGLDLNNKDVLDNMDAELEEKLKEFEKEHSNLLLGIILSTEMEDPFHIQEGKESILDKQINLNYKFTYWLAGIIITVSFIYIFGITWLPIPKDNLRYADTILGVVIGGVMQTIINFFFSNNTNFNEFKSIRNGYRNDRNNTPQGKKPRPCERK